MFLINHESEDPDTGVQIVDPPCEIGGVIDLGIEQRVPFKREMGEVTLKLSVPWGGTRLLHLVP